MKKRFYVPFDEQVEIAKRLITENKLAVTAVLEALAENWEDHRSREGDPDWERLITKTRKLILTLFPFSKNQILDRIAARKQPQIQG